MLHKIINDIDKELAAFLKKDLLLQQVKHHSSLLASGIKDFAGRPGKRIRPALFALGYLGYTKRTQKHYNNIIKASLSQEFLHDFLLIHDDIIDNSALRRGKPTLHRFFNSSLSLNSKNKLGSDLGIVAGDIIFALSIESLNSIDETQERKKKALTLFNSATVLTGVGEFIDVINNIKPLGKIKEKEVYITYILKTAKYTFEFPMVIGSTLAGAPAGEVKKLSDLGLLLGQAFQIIDDMLDIFSSSIKTGKPVLSDLLEGKKTLLVFKAYSALKKTDKVLFKKLFEKENKTKKDLTKLKQLIEKTNAKSLCLKKATDFLKKSEIIYSSLNMKKTYKSALYMLIQQLNKSLQEFNSKD